ncbi:MAG: ABC transporter ATP-binding protein/permease [Spirochaetaceae bacterium]|nr:ABC transporter ATP-binding protein/permease [Spirochaetaceae bacterium]
MTAKNAQQGNNAVSDFFASDDIVKDYDTVIVRRIWSYIKKYKGLVVLTAISLIISTAGELAVPVMEKHLIDEAIIPGDFDKITVICMALLGVLCAVFAASFVQTWSSSLTGQLVMEDLRVELFRKTLFQSTTFLSRHPVGRIVNRLTGDVETINEFFTTVVVAFLKDFSIIAGVLVTLLVLSPVLALVVLACLPAVVLVSMLSRVRARDAFRRQRTASSAINAYLSERISGIGIVQLFRGEKKSRAEYAQRNDELLHANLAEILVLATFRPIVEFLSILTTAAVIGVGANLLLNLELSLGVLIAFINLIAMFFAPVMDISEKYTILQQAMAGSERVFQLLDTNEMITDTALPHEQAITGVIEFKNVVFSYKQGEPVLKELSFKVERGEKAAIVGYTGAGKTTITNILTRLWDIDSGVIMLDGMNIKDIPLATLRRGVLPVLQDVFLFSGTIAENISLGLPLERAQIEEAARSVHAHEFISKLPDGYDTMLSEGATNISSGQRQLLSFARVIANNPAVVVLDEATSSVDTETERLIELGIETMLAGRTSLVIAHRLSTIRNAHRILVLSNGVLLEEGTHETLFAQNGLYAHLYRLQADTGE